MTSSESTANVLHHAPFLLDVSRSHSRNLLLQCTYNAIKNYRGQTQVAHKLFMTLLGCFRIILNHEMLLSSRATFADHIETLTYLFEVPLGDVPDEHRWNEATNSALDLIATFFDSPFVACDPVEFYDTFLTHRERMSSITRYVIILKKTHDPDYPRKAGFLFHQLAHCLNQQEARYQQPGVAEFKEAYAQLPPEILHGSDAASSNSGA